MSVFRGHRGRKLALALAVGLVVAAEILKRL